MTQQDDLGTVYPPRNKWDVAAYQSDEVVAGYRDYNINDPTPGENHSPAYRWGWANRRRDSTHKEDGFEGIRHEYIRMVRNKN